MTSPVVAIRTDYGIHTGFGHLRRCLSLAAALENLGASVRFVVSRDPGTSQSPPASFESMTEVGAADAADLHETRAALRSSGASAIVLDSYQVPPAAMTAFGAKRAAIIDHVPATPLPVDVLVNGSLEALEGPVAAQPDTVLLLGPEFILLRPEFARARELRSVRARVSRVLVTIGGSDPTGLSVAFVSWVREVFADSAIDVIVGPYFTAEALDALGRAAKLDARIVLHRNPGDVRGIMLDCDLALTAGGQTTYELAATGTPAVAVAVAENQAANLRGLASRGALMWAGSAGDDDLHARTRRCLETLRDDVDARREMSRAALGVVDGRGAERVAVEILKLCGEETS